MRPKYIIVRKMKEHHGYKEEHHPEKHHKSEQHDYHHESKDEKLEREYQESRKEFITDTLAAMKGYKNYVEKHGTHFTDELAEWVSKQMVNKNGEKDHHWSVSDVKGAFDRLGLKKPNEATWGDATYAANMAYADYLGHSVKSDVDAVKHGYDDISDPDGYPGKVFNRWTSDVIGKHIDVPWEKFI